tara:strand:- start:304 stop:1194 length:891 start_codon:yes stop_codon:yes gene_type:complete
MASVQMSQTLREQMLSNYGKQVRAAYENKSGVAQVVSDIKDTVSGKVPLINDFISLSSEAEALLKDFKYQVIQNIVGDKSNDLAKSEAFWKRSMFDSWGGKPNILSLNPSHKIYAVINDQRPIEENLEHIFDWNPKYEYSDYYKTSGHTHNPASDNYVDGDMYFEYEFTEPVLLPFTLDGSMSDYQAKADYAPHIDIGLVISDPEMYNVLKQVPETDMKVADAVKKMEDCLMQFSTLKKFLDEFSGGMALVPEEYKQRLAKKAQPKKPAKVKPAAVIPDDIKEEMAEVVFENSLLK